MNYTLFFLLIFSNLFAAPPIEGGKAVPLSNIDYIDVVRLEDSQGISCTGTRIAQHLVLTAAHCVLNTENNYLPRYSESNMVGILGSVKKVHVHPRYVSAHKKKDAYAKIIDKDPDIRANEAMHRELMETHNGRTTLYDIAILEFKKRKSNRQRPYPQIISKDTKFKERKSVNLVGYGDLRMTWNGENFESESNFLQQQMAGTNEWSTCPLPLLNSDLQAIEDLANDVLNTLKVESLRTHEIVNGTETIISDGTAMILSGDSGSPSLERDAKGELVITGVASNIVRGVAEGTRATLEVRDKNGKLLEKTEFENFPDNWGHAQKADAEFPEIASKLKELGVKESEVTIKRIYKRTTIGNFADLSHPENQNFIQKVIEEAR